MLVFALLGLLANLISIGLLSARRAESLNMRGAFLEALSDAFGSGAALVAALVVLGTGFQRADSIASLLIAVLILPRAWSLLRECVGVLLEEAPRGLDVEVVRGRSRGRSSMRGRRAPIPPCRRTSRSPTRLLRAVAWDRSSTSSGSASPAISVSTTPRSRSNRRVIAVTSPARRTPEQGGLTSPQLGQVTGRLFVLVIPTDSGGHRDRVTEGSAPVWQFIEDRRVQILINAWNHAYLVILAVILATVIAILLAMVVTRIPRLEPAANALSAVGLTIPSFALIGLLLPVTGLGSSNAVVGLAGVDANLVESARGMGMGEVASMFRIRLPLAWPVILAGIRISTQMCMGIAAIAAYVLGPGLGVSIFVGLAQLGGKNAVNYAVVGTVGIVIIALVLDLLLLALGRVTTSKGIRV